MTTSVKSPVPATVNVVKRVSASSLLSAAKRLMQVKGVSPRSTTTEYFRPTPVTKLTNLPPFAYSGDSCPTKTQTVSVPSDTDSEDPEALPSPPHSEYDAAAYSPSMTRSPPAQPTSRRRAAIVAAPASAVDPISGILAVGLRPFKVVSFTLTGDEIVVAVTPFGERVGLYYARDIAAPLRAAGKMFASVETEFVSERVIHTVAEAESLGAEKMGWVAGLSAEYVNAGENSLIFGTMSSATSAANPAASRYFAILYGDRGDEDPAASLSEPRREASPFGGGGKGSSSEVFVFAQNAAAEKELLNGKKAAMFARPRATIPIVHSTLIEDGRVRDVISEVSLALSKSERLFYDIAAAAEESAIERVNSIVARMTRLRENISHCASARESVASALAKSSKSHTPDDISKRVEVTLYASKIEEILGDLWQTVDGALATAEAKTERAETEAFVETRISLVPDVSARKFAYARSVKWGFPKSLDAFDFTKGPVSDDCPEGVSMAISDARAVRARAASPAR